MSAELSREIANKFTKMCKLDNSLILKNLDDLPIAVVVPGCNIIGINISSYTNPDILEYLYDIFDTINNYKAIIAKLYSIETDKTSVYLEYDNSDIRIDKKLHRIATMMHFDEELYNFARRLPLGQSNYTDYKLTNSIKYSYIKCNDVRHIRCYDVSMNDSKVETFAANLNKNIFNIFKDQLYHASIIIDNRTYYTITIEYPVINLTFITHDINDYVLNLILEISKQSLRLSKSYYFAICDYQFNFKINNSQIDIVFKKQYFNFNNSNYELTVDTKHLIEAFGNLTTLLDAGEKKLINLIKDKIDNYDTFVDILTDFYTNLLLNNDVHIMSLPRNLPFYINNAINQTLVNYSF